MKLSKENLKKSLLLYAVTDRRWLNGRPFLDVVKESLDGGVTFLQLREKDLEEESFLQEAVKLQALCRDYHVPFIVNDNVEIAKKMNADGVHVGQSDMEAGLVREELGPDKILGVSAETVEQAVLAEQRGADYLGVGAVFPTGSKDDAEAVSPDTLKAICQAVQIPVVAIGGITEENVELLQGTGICGVAVISAIYAKPDIKKAAKDLKAKTRRVVEKKIRGVIFDLDGVLLDSMGIWKDLGARFLRERGVKPAADLGDILFSMSMEQGAEYLKKQYSLPETEAEIVEEISRMLKDFYFYEVAAKPGAEELLSSLKKAGIPMAAATSSPREHVTKALDRLGLLPFLDTIITTGETGTSKHSSKIYDLAAKALSAEPKDIMVLEDSLYALQTAHDAGYLTVGVKDENGETDQEGLKETADFYAETLPEVGKFWQTLSF